MKIRRQLCVLLIASACVQPEISFAESDEIPVISIVFPGLLDQACSRLSGKPLNREAMDELDARIDEFIEAWDSVGPSLMKEVVAITGVPFPFRERVAVLHTCEGLPSMSAPLSIKSNFYLRSGHPEDPWPVSRFATNFLFHEVLHNYLAITFGDEILEEFGDLPPLTRNHLHLMALEKAVFSRHGLSDAIAFNSYFNSGKPAYQRAADIVEEKGIDYFLDQLKE